MDALAGSASDAPSSSLAALAEAALTAPAGAGNNGTQPKKSGGGICIDLVSPHTPRGVVFNNLVRACVVCVCLCVCVRERERERASPLMREHEDELDKVRRERGGEQKNSLFCPIIKPNLETSTTNTHQVIALPSACFLAFLALRFRASTRRLRAARSHMMWAYYCACWAVSLLALLRAALLTVFVESNFSPSSSSPSSPSPSSATAAAAANAHATLLNALWLLTRGGLTLLEVSVVVFLAQG